MANLIIYNRAIQLLTFHPDWVDGCPGCPSPIEPLLMRAQGFLLRDIAGVLKQPKLAEQLRQLGRSMVVKSSGRGEKSFDKILATTLRNIAGELSKDAFEQGRKAWII
ncbi:hypothetical protein [Runella zeae]|uniref:hypothetical protein n=1 Tax=Runella zeae TaxID=94255 RepID=UPI00048A685D|nr:hypothetical protein [Runella zeae]